MSVHVSGHVRRNVRGNASGNATPVCMQAGMRADGHASGCDLQEIKQHFFGLVGIFFDVIPAGVTQCVLL